MVASGAGHKDIPDKVKSKEKDSVEKEISDDPVKSTPPAKEQTTGMVSILLLCIPSCLQSFL